MDKALKKELASKPPAEIARYWFDYWNERYPVPGLTFFIEDSGFIENWAGYADMSGKKTAFNVESLLAHIGAGTARHEQVHHLLRLYGYETKHTLLFALVNNALAYRDSLTGQPAMKNVRMSALNSVVHYDLHEEVNHSQYITTRHFSVLAKRLSRIADIEDLIMKANYYADQLRFIAKDHPCKQYARAIRLVGEYAIKADEAVAGLTIEQEKNRVEREAHRVQIRNLKRVLGFVVCALALALIKIL